MQYILKSVQNQEKIFHLCFKLFQSKILLTFYTEHEIPISQYFLNVVVIFEKLQSVL